MTTLDPYFGPSTVLTAHGRLYTFISHLYSHAPLLDRGIDDPLHMCIELE